ncbi:PAS domain S-box protein [Geomonas agri]|uniref:PAS domain S-box protein n=1 Tax=Geomonas agri TaxID=2873702 RepID=UPI001CD2ACF6|nr:transporter substrate-binding domain-containing protein [Geomonas agri]
MMKLRLKYLLASLFLALLLVGRVEADPPDWKPTALPLSTQERAWLASHPVVRVRVSRNYPPFEFFAEGRFQGMAWDYLEILGRELGVTFQPAPDMPWGQALSSLEQKTGVDMVLMITPDPSRRSFVEFTAEYLSFPQVIFTRKDFRFIASLADLNDGSVATEKGFIEAERLRRDLPHLKVVEAPSTARALELVATGAADACVANLAVGSYLMAQKGLADLKVAAPSIYPEETYAVGVRKDWAPLARILDKGLAAIPQSQRQQIQQRWLSIRYEHGLRPIDILAWVLGVAVVALAFILQLRRMVQHRTAELERVIEEQGRTESALRQRETELQSLYMAAPIGIAYVKDRVMLRVNDALCRQSGFSREELVGNSTRIFYPSDAAWEAAAEKLYQESVIENGAAAEMPLFTKNGDATDVLVSVAPLARGDLSAGYVAMVLDITERKKAVLALKESEERFQTIFNESPIRIVLNELERGTYVDVNKTFCEVAGISREEAVGKTPEQLGLITHEDHERLVGLLTRNGSIEQEEIVSVMEGVETVALLSTRIIEIGNVPVALSMLQDITARKRAEEALIQNEKMTMIAGMAAGVAHEVNNPLGIIAQDLQNLERRLSPALPGNNAAAAKLGLDLGLVERYLEAREITGYLSSMRKAVKRASLIISGMLQFSRASGAKQQLVTLEEVMEQSLQLALSDFDLRTRYDFRNLSLAKEYDAAAPKASLCVPEMEQVFINLLKNAAQALLHEGAKGAQIRIRTWHDAERVFVSIADNGPGMSESVRRRIFDPFFTTKEIGSGTGLGLSISYAIVTKNHRGEISVESAEGQGSCFTVSLPRTAKE